MDEERPGVILEHLRKLAARAGGPESDRELLQRFARRRDEAAFAALVRRHGPMVLQVCRRLLHNSHDAEEVCQAVFLVLAAKAGSRHWQESLPGWLHRVAYHLALKAKRAAARRCLHESRAKPAPPVDPVRELAGRDLLTALDEALMAGERGRGHIARSVRGPFSPPPFPLPGGQGPAG